MNEIAPGLHLSPEQVASTVQWLAVIGGGFLIAGLGLLYILVRMTLSSKIAELKAHFATTLPIDFVPRPEAKLHFDRLDRLEAIVERSTERSIERAQRREDNPDDDQ